MVNNHNSRAIYRNCMIVLIFLLLQSCRASSTDTAGLSIPYIPEIYLKIDGNLSDWENIESYFLVDEFYSPWRKKAFGKTVFKAVRDTEWFYFYFDVADHNLIIAPFTEESDVALGDRVEFFVSGDIQLSNYYCVEVSPNGDILDYQARYYREFDNSWNLENMDIKTGKSDEGYCVEGKLPISFLKNLDPSSKDNSFKIWLGLYRAEFNRMGEEDNQINWISWIKPKSDHPDFHISSSFQLVNFMY